MAKPSQMTFPIFSLLRDVSIFKWKFPFPTLYSMNFQLYNLKIAVIITTIIIWIRVSFHISSNEIRFSKAEFQRYNSSAIYALNLAIGVFEFNLMLALQNTNSLLFLIHLIFFSSWPQIILINKLPNTF